MSEKSTRKPLILGLAGFFLIVLIAFAAAELCLAYKARNRQSAINCVLNWGRFAPFPASAEPVHVSTEGTAFSRAFRVTFHAPQADIDQWIKDSPGTRALSPQIPSPGKRHFEIPPGGGAMHADATVDDAKHEVTIYVCWS